MCSIATRSTTLRCCGTPSFGCSLWLASSWSARATGYFPRRSVPLAERRRRRDARGDLMRRDPQLLVEREFDLAVVGGGIFGICTAWEAALRGLSVALIERADFVHATSAHSFRMVHGGIRYLQHGDLP